MLQYVPIMSVIENCLTDASKFGYLKASIIEPCNAKIMNISTEAVKDCKENVCVKVADKYREDNVNHVTATVCNSLGEHLTVQVNDNCDGSLTIGYTPVDVGVHVLFVCMYGVHIEGSPVNINVTEEQELFTKGNKTGTKKIQVSMILGGMGGWVYVDARIVG